jgi:hypothetical protein
VSSSLTIQETLSWCSLKRPRGCKVWTHSYNDKITVEDIDQEHLEKMSAHLRQGFMGWSTGSLWQLYRYDHDRPKCSVITFSPLFIPRKHRLGDAGLKSERLARLAYTASRSDHGSTSASKREYSVRGLDDAVRRKVTARKWVWARKMSLMSPSRFQADMVRVSLDLGDE